MKPNVRPSRTGERPNSAFSARLFAIRRVTHKSGFALLVAFLLCSLNVPLPALAQDDGLGSLGPEGQAIAQAINAVRADNGLAPLRVHSLLNQAAQNHVDDLIANGMYGHYGSDGSNVRTRVLRTGYGSGWVSENWVTSGSAAGAMAWWMNDWIHRVNILDASWDEVGIGAGLVSNGYYIFVTDFANADGADTYAAVAPQAAAESASSPEVVPSEGGEYTVRGGDTLLAIGLRYGVEWQDIALANGMGENEVLSIGRVLTIPGFETSVPESVAIDGRLYTVQAGDTLSGIALRFSITWEDVAAANRLGEFTVLQIGMQIRLPGVAEESGGDAGSAAENDADADAAEPSNDDGDGEDEQQEPIVYTTELLNVPQGFATGGTGGTSKGTPYTVKPGDTLFSIAARNYLTWQQLADANAMDEDALLQIGQTITLPVRENMGAAAVLAPPTPLVVTVARTYTVKAGDTVISIAARNGIGWKALLDLNGLDEDSLLQVGDVLTLGE